MRELTIKAKEHKGLGPLRQEWISGKGEGVEFSLDSTAGMGGAHLVLRVEKDGKTLREIVDIRPMLEEWVDQVAEELSEEGKNDE